MTRVGAIIKGLRLFIRRYLQVGGVTTGIIVGEDNHGTISEYLTSRFNGTGAIGKKTGTGKSNKPGASRV
jgi:hypothetical protein